ncbi:glycoside hydrolase family 3 N-terminal domain-containing protein [Actinacidiphila acidipaludis]|uniref:beta-N-acetylhexosaminidase n=1 Tax=Actinacidiphila acidipaludis TaxID=2873382 RepID=A0ABS7Q8B2_9ACTN|nr:glycoside hydrolase family 3 N-terminal domain-containing protein [Streptomyces acidipaludis]MBY8879412.1 glycoside hydrolase family 3 protein [Streptomyces acidipaludis]
MRKTSVHARSSRRRAARSRGGHAAVALGVLLAVAACGNGNSSSSGTPTASGTTGTTASPTTSPGSTPPGSPTTHRTVPPPPRTTTSKAVESCVNRVYDGMTQAQRVGQLFMTAVSTSGVTSSEAAAITQGRTGAVILMGHSSAGTSAVKSVTNRSQGFSPTVRGVTVHMLVSTDQEGGKVQVLNGPGFSTMPSAVTQGTWSTSQLQSSATTWGRQLRAAGVNMNLAPIADTVPPNLVTVNAPIGKLDRNYGTNPATVATHSTAFLRGMQQAGVLPTAKHFPGLGRVTGNTDTTADVRDTVTTRNDAYLAPFRSAVQAGSPFIMVSSAIYTKIDPASQAAFSSTVIRGMLRGDLGFQGVVISDDLGNAVAVQDHTPAQRAVDFIAAGGDIVLTVKPSDIGPMTAAVIKRIPQDAAFSKDVQDAVHRVLNEKHNAGLLSCG